MLEIPTRTPKLSVFGGLLPIADNMFMNAKRHIIDPNRIGRFKISGGRSPGVGGAHARDVNKEKKTIVIVDQLYVFGEATQLSQFSL
jgi:hypothetical protein